jgi:hypothetical protein
VAPHNQPERRLYDKQKFFNDEENEDEKKGAEGWIMAKYMLICHLCQSHNQNHWTA